MASRRAGRRQAPPKRTNAGRLRLFCEVVEKARWRRAITGPTIEAGIKFHFSHYEDPSVETRLGDEDDVRSLMADLRKFLSDDSDVHFYGIANIVELSVTDDEMKDANRHNREGWKSALTESALPFRPQNRSPEAWFDLIVNGEVFHDDADKRAEFESLPEDLQAIGRTTVNAMMIRMLGVLWPERNLIADALERGAFRSS
jgi:hypothetical protein